MDAESLLGTRLISVGVETEGRLKLARFVPASRGIKPVRVRSPRLVTIAFLPVGHQEWAASVHAQRATALPAGSG